MRSGIAAFGSGLIKFIVDDHQNQRADKISATADALVRTKKSRNQEKQAKVKAQLTIKKH